MYVKVKFRITQTTDGCFLWWYAEPSSSECCANGMSISLQYNT